MEEERESERGELHEYGVSGKVRDREGEGRKEG